MFFLCVFVCICVYVCMYVCVLVRMVCVYECACVRIGVSAFLSDICEYRYLRESVCGLLDKYVVPLYPANRISKQGKRIGLF